MTVRLASLGLILALGACGTSLDQVPVMDTGKPVPLKVIYRGSHCPAVQPSIQVIRDSDAWDEWQRRRQRMFFSASDEPNAATAELDFGNRIVIVISMGQKPTPGYSIDVPESSGMLRGASLNISSVWRQPPEGAILPQVLTSPCIAITLLTGQYSVVKVEDQNGDIVFDQRI